MSGEALRQWGALDLALMAAGLLAVVLGWRRGAIRTALALLGSVIGAVAAFTALGVVNDQFPIALPRPMLLVLGVLIGAAIGASVLGWLSMFIVSGLSVIPGVRVMDRAAGAVIGLSAVAIIGWWAASLLALVPIPAVAAPVAGSRLVPTLDLLMPRPVRDGSAWLGQQIGGDWMTERFMGIVTGPTASAPSPVVTIVPSTVEAAIPATVRVDAAAPACNALTSVSGFIVGPSRVLTVGHAIAGSEVVVVRPAGRGAPRPAIVVGLDRVRDVAVLEVTGLTAAPLPLAGPATRGEPVTVLGYAGGAGVRPVSATVVRRSRVQATDIDGRQPRARTMVVLAMRARAGDAGAAVLNESGSAIGMVTAGGPAGTQTAFALPAGTLGPIADAAGSRPVDTGACAGR
ncbi:MAG: CvpA family protein [Actinomycetales bacterium]|nr:CvpA family protein [Actinomycetales bacterium]